MRGVNVASMIDLDEYENDPVVEVVGEFAEEEAKDYLEERGLEFPF